MFTRRGFLKFLGLGIASVGSIIGLPVYEALGTPRVTQYSLKLEGWANGPTLKVCLLADFHACDPWMTLDRIKAICDQANSLKADIILLLGDYISSMKYKAENVPSHEWAAAFMDLKAPLGVHAILGNHDYWEDLDFQLDPSRETDAEKALKAAGIPVYVNKAVRLEKDGRPFWLAGLGDQLALYPGMRFNRAFLGGIDDMAQTLSDVTDDAPILLMAHEPDIFPQVPARVALTLSGHTHGGQLNLFGWRPISASPGSKTYPVGHFERGASNLVVSGGLGCSGLPMRIGSWPEIVLLDLEQVS